VSSVDVDRVKKVFGSLEVLRRLGTTTIYVTHDQIEARTMGDKIVIMNSGKVEQIGAPLEIYDRPHNLFVAGFIGSPAMNFLPGQISSGDFVLEDGTVLQMPEPISRHNGQKVRLGVRPEHLRPSTTGIPVEVRVRVRAFSHRVKTLWKVRLGVAVELRVHPICFDSLASVRTERVAFRCAIPPRGPEESPSRAT